MAKFLTNLDLNKNELQNAKLQNLGEAPANPVRGQIYFNSTTGVNRAFVYNGSSWVGMDAVGATMTGQDIVTAINSSSNTIDLDNLNLSAYNGAGTITNVGTITTGVWNGSTIDVAHGGTGATTLTSGYVVTGNTTGAVVMVSRSGIDNRATFPPDAHNHNSLYQPLNATLNTVANGTYTGDDSITTVGTVNTGTWNATAITPAKGGTGLTSITNVGELYFGNTTSAMGRIAPVAAGSILVSNGVAAAPIWSAASGLTVGKADALNTARNFSISGNATAAAVSFNGSADVALSITSVNSAALNGTIPSTVLGNSTVYVGTTGIALNRGSGSLSLTGVNIDGSAGSATSATNTSAVLVADDTSATVFYPTFVGGNTGNQAVKVTQSKLTYQPSTGTLSTTLFAGSGASLTNLNASNIAGGTIPTGILGNSTLYVGTTSVALNRASANLDLTGITSINMPTAASNFTVISASAGGNYTATLPAKTGTVAMTSDIITPGAGALTVGTNTVASGTAVGIALNATYNANSSSAAQINLAIGPAISNLATFMNTGTAGFVKRTGVDTYGIDTNTYLTSYTETTTLQNAASRGAWSNVAITINNSTTSTTSSTGALVVSGGVGVGENLNVGGNVIITGNLTVEGTTVTTNTSVLQVEDPIITVGGTVAPVADDAKDRGIEFRWYNTQARTGFFGFDRSTGKFTFIPQATNTNEVFSGTKGTLDANIEWADVLNKALTAGTSSTQTGSSGLTISGTTIAHADTSTLSGAQGTAGIASVTVDGLGHITAVTPANYSVTSGNGAYGYPTKYAKTFGDGTNTSYVINHALGTTDVVVTLYEVSSSAVVYADTISTNSTHMTINVATAPGADALRVVIIG